MKIQIKKLTETAKIPTCGSLSAAGYDMYADAIILSDGSRETGEYIIMPHTTTKVGTGIATAIPEGYFGAIYARSGLATKQGLRPANCVGVLDSDYRGEIIVALHNDTDEEKTIECGDRICQLVVMPYLNCEFECTDELDETERGACGFGSTGKK